LREPLDLDWVLADEQRLEIGADEMCARDLILAAPARGARRFAETD
jgi:hypothetical protein